MNDPGAATPSFPTAIVEDEVLAEYGVIILQVHHSAQIALELGRPSAGRLLHAGRGGATLRSGGFDHWAHVRLELWPSQPSGPPDPQAWDGREEGELNVDATELRLASATAGVSERPLRLPAPGRYRIRAHSAGGHTVRDHFTAADHGVPGFPRGLERWLLQLWPSKIHASGAR
ncbi:hypothetical protein AB0H18_42105 [Streptomyces sp. NPDC020766]|uniref:hypothetical protein n=1 Tax=Streptomyces sp. NPDC020766 TaxID=3155011 RepID=UPI0033F6FBB1